MRKGSNTLVFIILTVVILLVVGVIKAGTGLPVVWLGALAIILLHRSMIKVRGE